MSTIVNFRLPDLPDPEDRYSDRLGHREMAIPTDGDTVLLDQGCFRVLRTETLRVEVLWPPGAVSLVTIATVTPVGLGECR